MDGNIEHNALIVDKHAGQSADAQTDLSAIGSTHDVPGPKRDAPDETADDETAVDTPATKKPRTETHTTTAGAIADVALECDSHQPADVTQLPGTEEQAVTVPAAEQPSAGSLATNIPAEQPKLLPSTSPKTSSAPSAAAAVATVAAVAAHRSASPTSKKKPQGDIVFRLLIHHRATSSVIGKGGSTVREIQGSTGARIQVLQAIPGCEEKVVVISMPETAEAAVNGAEKALLAVQRRLMLDLEPSAAAALNAAIQEPVAPESAPASTSAAALGLTAATAEDTMQFSAVSAAGEAKPVDSAATALPEQQQQHEADIGQLSTAGAVVNGTTGDDENSGSAGKADAEAADQGVGDAGQGQAATAAEQAPPALVLPTEDIATEGCAPCAADVSGRRSPTMEQPVTEAGQPADAGVVLLAAETTPSVVPPSPTAASTPTGRAASSPAAAAAAVAGRSQAASSSSPAKAALSPRAMQHQARLLISTSQANSLLTAGAGGLRSVKEGSGAYVKVLPPDEAPLCALEGDRVTQIGGRADQVVKAVQLLAAHLRKHPPTDRPGPMHPALAARVAAARRHQHGPPPSRGGFRSPPPPPPPPRYTYGPGYGAPGFGQQQYGGGYGDYGRYGY